MERFQAAFYPSKIKTIGDHLKKKRLDLKMTQKDIAAEGQTGSLLDIDEEPLRNPCPDEIQGRW